jgi:hypothetical protein
MVDATGARKISRRMVSERTSQHAFFGVLALLFAAIAAMPMLMAAVSHRGVEVPYGTP